MKCLACSAENNLKDRTAHNGRCSRCGHRFVFEPTAMRAGATFTDLFFSKAIADLSADGTLYFTPRQLYFLLNRRLKRKSSINAAGCVSVYVLVLIIATLASLSAISEMVTYPLHLILIPVIGVSLLALLIAWSGYRNKTANTRQRRAYASTIQAIGGVNLIIGVGFNLFLFSPVLGFFASLVWLVISVPLGVFLMVLGHFQKSRLMNMGETPLFEMSQLHVWLSQWSQVNGRPPTLLQAPSTDQPPAQVNPEITHYSFDRVLVTSSTAIAQMLIANNLHLEHNCAILSLSRYPQPIFNTVMEMLRRNPDLTVYVLHDASPQGMRLLHTLKTSPEWFRDQEVQFVDLGLSPRQIFAQGNFAVFQSASSATESKQLSPGVRQTLSPEELKWLDAGNFVELEAFGPQKLLQVIRMGISTSLTGSSDDQSLWSSDGGSALFLTSFG